MNMKKATLTEDKAEKTPTGGVLVGKRKGQTIIHDKGTLSGYLVGKTHAEGGIKAINKSTGQPLEMQGGEVVITAPAVSDQTKNNFNGKMMTNREVLSQINVNGGGVAFANGGDIPKDIKRTGASYNYGGKTMTDHEIYKRITGGHLAEGMTLSQIAKMHKVSIKELQKQVDMGMKAESEHTSSKREQMKIVKDHLFENPKYYTLLKKAGLKRGGKIEKENLVKDAKEGNTPARDLNNYNDVLDLDADGVVGAETGLFADGGVFDTEPFLNYYFDEIAEFLKYQNDITLNKDFTFKHRGELFKIEPIILSEKNIKEAYFSIIDLEDEEVGAIQFNPNDKKQFSAYSDFFEWNNLKFDDGGSVKPYDANMEGDSVDGIVGDETGLYAKGGIVITSVKDIPNFEQRLNERRISYRGLGTGKLSDDFYELAGENGTRIKVDGKEYFITETEFDTFSRDENGKLRVRFEAPTRKFNDGGANDLPKVEFLKVSSTGSSLSSLNGKEFYSFKEFKEAVESVYKTLNQNIKSSMYLMANGMGISFSTYISAGKNTVANFNPYTGKPSDLEKVFTKRHRYRFNQLNWQDWFGVQEKTKTTRSKKTPTQTPTSTPASTNESKKIEVQMLVDSSDNGIYGANELLENLKKSYKDFPDKINFSFYIYDINNYRRDDVLNLKRGIKTPAELITYITYEPYYKDYDWTNFFAYGTKSKDIEVTSMIIEYYDNDENKISKNIDNVLDLKEELEIIQKNNNTATKFVYLNPIEGANPTGVESKIYLTNSPSDKDDFNPLNSSISDLKFKLKKILFEEENYNWNKFFDWTDWTEKESQTQTPTTPEPVKSNRNFELERKYLTGRINDLSKELDMKRPSLPNEEIAFYQREINKFILKLRKVMNDQNEEKPITERIEAVYGAKWGQYDKQYPETDLVSYNGVKSELTEEEYLTVRTPEFKAFFGDWEQGGSAGFSKVINPKTKEPLAVWHGTNVLFTEWKTYATNNAHYFSTKRDFSEFFASEWENRTDKAGVDSKVLKDLNPNKGKFMFRCFIDVRNPIDFSRFGVDKRPISDYLTFLKINYNIGDYDFWTGLGNASGVTKDTKVYAWQIIRLWQNFTTYVKLYTTYDGYIFYEYNPNTPSGGIDNASLCFCAFESNQVKFTNAYEFNALSNDSRFDFGGTL